MNRPRSAHSGNIIDQSGTPALLIDEMLSELSRLYVERFKALRTGDPRTIQTITEKIHALKFELNRL